MKSLLFAAIGLALFTPLALGARECAAADVPTSTTVSRPSDTPRANGEVRHRHRRHVHLPYYVYPPYYAYSPYAVTPYVAPYTYGPAYSPIYPVFVTPYQAGYRYPGAAW